MSPRQLAPEEIGLEMPAAVRKHMLAGELSPYWMIHVRTDAIDGSTQFGYSHYFLDPELRSSYATIFHTYFPGNDFTSYLEGLSMARGLIRAEYEMRAKGYQLVSERAVKALRMFGESEGAA